MTVGLSYATRKSPAGDLEIGKPDAQSSGESQIGRLVRVLEAFDSCQTLTASDIARRASLPTPTAHRLARALSDQGLLVRLPDRSYRMGIRLWELATRKPVELTLRDRALPYMEDVQSVLRHHTQLWVLDGVEMIVVERLTNPGSSSANITRVAGRMPAATVSSGLVVAAFGTSELQEAVANSSWHHYTARTPTDPHFILERMAQARNQGYIICEGWIHESATGIWVPVRDQSGEVIAALSAIVPSGSEFVRTAIPALLTAAHGITRSLSRPRRKTSMELLALESFFRRSEHLQGHPTDPVTLSSSDLCSCTNIELLRGEDPRRPWYFEDFAAGQVFTSQRRTVTEANVVNFSAWSWDTNPVHTDSLGAADGRFGHRIAQGLLGMSVAMGLAARLGVFEDCSVALLGVDEWKFRGPVAIGDSVICTVEITGTRRTSAGDTGVLNRRFTLLNQAGLVVQDGMIDLLVRCRSQA